jgi:hypothetical protein
MVPEDMSRILVATSIALTLFGIAPAQSRSDLCHVYVVDVATARKALAGFQESGDRKADAKRLSAGQTVFPEFRPVIGEEELTTKTYRFPGSNLTITASVYYTDESMASSQTNNSLTLGIMVSRKATADATSGENSAIVEVTYNEDTDTVRAKKYLRVNGRLYLVGIECHCKQTNRSR